MEQWRGRTALITGAGGTIGSKIAEDLVKAGMIVIGLDHKEDKLELLAQRSLEYLQEKYPGQLVPRKCDVCIEDEVVATFNLLTSIYGSIDVLINCAAIYRDGMISTGNFDDFRLILDTNLFGLSTVTKLTIDSIKNYGTNGHIINLNSICGHYMPNFKEPRMNLYVTSKAAMTSFTEMLRQEFRFLRYDIKVTSISPGIVQSQVFTENKTRVFDEQFLASNPALLPEDISNIVLNTLGTPPHVQIHEVMVHALHEPL